jgi:two-component system NtrC family sensor kinase
MFSTRPGEINTQVDKRAEACSLCHASLQPLVRVDVPSRARIFRGPDNLRKLAMITPIYNEAACSQAECHAHPESVKVLGVLDLVLDFDPIDREVSNIQYRAMLSTGISVILVGLFIVFFTRRFVDKPIRRLIEGTRAVSAMQLDRPIEVKTSGELGELGRSFNFMREQLKDAMDEISRFTQNLESKVTERTEQLKTAHQKLLQSDRLASLGQLSASVAHEINNPLSGVLNLSMLMQRILRDDGIPPDRVPEFRKYLSQVIHETSRVGRIVSDLLAFSRRSKPQKAPADINGIIEMTRSVVSHKLKLANVEVSKALDERLPELFCDRSQMQQVVMNLLLNAAEAVHNRPDGKVSILTRLSPSREAIVMEIQDNGEGIPQENLPKIFDPFFTTKEEGKGVGLGLTVVYGIVAAHGGEIEVQSTVGSGTLFRVTLPLSESPGGQNAGFAGSAEKGHIA